MSGAGRDDETTLHLSVRARAWISGDELAAAAGISRATLARLVRLGLLEPDAPEGNAFSAPRVLHLRRMLRLRRELELDLIGAAMVADLIERIERLETELDRLRSRS